jgi:hypothetical protein
VKQHLEKKKPKYDPSNWSDKTKEIMNQLSVQMERRSNA